MANDYFPFTPFHENNPPISFQCQPIRKVHWTQHSLNLTSKKVFKYPFEMSPLPKDKWISRSLRASNKRDNKLKVILISSSTVLTVTGLIKVCQITFTWRRQNKTSQLWPFILFYHKCLRVKSGFFLDWTWSLTLVFWISERITLFILFGEFR